MLQKVMLSFSVATACQYGLVRKIDIYLYKIEKILPQHHLLRPVILAVTFLKILAHKQSKCFMYTLCLAHTQLSGCKQVLLHPSHKPLHRLQAFHTSYRLRDKSRSCWLVGNTVNNIIALINTFPVKYCFHKTADTTLAILDAFPVALEWVFFHEIICKHQSLHESNQSSD